MPEGNLTPTVYLVGEAPGRQEADAGRPFVGPAGMALRDMIREAGMEDAQIRLANALPFRPIERAARRGLRNRRPTEKDLRDSGGLVLADIATVQPNIIIALGKSAACLFGATTTIENARRNVFCFEKIPVPDYLSSGLRAAVRRKRVAATHAKDADVGSSGPQAVYGRWRRCFCFFQFGGG